MKKFNLELINLFIVRYFDVYATIWTLWTSDGRLNNNIMLSQLLLLNPNNLFDVYLMCFWYTLWTSNGRLNIIIMLSQLFFLKPNNLFWRLPNMLLVYVRNVRWTLRQCICNHRVSCFFEYFVLRLPVDYVLEKRFCQITDSIVFVP